MAGSEEKSLQALRTAVKELERLRRENGRLVESQTGPIAIVGMSCRFAGGASDLEAYWRLLEQGRDAVSEVPPGRWDIDAWYDPDPDAAGKMTTRWGAFLPDIESFDPSFFEISPREAVSIDPQERLLLEVSWEALEHAGLTPERLMGSDTGVYVGICGGDYQLHTMADAQAIDAYSLLGTAHSAVVGRISYLLGLKGPNIAVDTACSSSLVSVHLACQALRRGECSLALAGGVNVVLAPEGTVYFSRLRAMSPTGRCHTFSADADGYVRGEGCGVVVLKRLSDAQRDGDRILAVIRGSAVNQDGRSNGLTAPNGPAQQAVIRKALAQAGVAPSEVDYVECHGTGTPLGDPIEVQALGAVLAEGRGDAPPVVLSSSKTNIGHTEGAAGVAGLIKAALALGNERIPKSLHSEKPNPFIPWSELPVKVATETLEWKRGAKPRRAGVSSFGFSGTNAHVVLEEAPAARAPVSPAVERAAELVVVAARSAAALSAQAGRLRQHLLDHPELALGDLAFSLATTRGAMEHRLALSVSSREALLTLLAAAASGESPAGVVRGTASSPGKLAFLFTGQGAQERGMGRALHAQWPAFRQAFDRCVSLFDAELGGSLREVMWAEPGSPSEGLLDQTGWTQPALFTLEYALFAQWRAWGIEPELLAGHSIGELVAACVAGVFSLEDAARLVAARGRLMQALPAGGAMVSIGAPEAEVAAIVEPHQASVSIAAVNGPSQVVVAGEARRVKEIASAFEARGVRTRELRVSHAFHSPLMAPMLEAFEQVARSVRYQAPAVALVSNLSGKLCGEEVAEASYWVRHVREAVRFADGVRALHEAGATTFVELGPKATLLGLVPSCLGEAEAGLVATLRAGRGEAASALEALGALWTEGQAVSWPGVFPEGGQRVPLPTYAWQRERFWLERKPGQAHPRPDPGTDWHYRLDWPLVPRAATPAVEAPGSWLAVAEPARGDELSSALRARGAVGVVAASCAEAAGLLRQGNWSGVVYLPAIDPGALASMPSDELEAAVQQLTSGAVLLAQAVSAAEGSPRLWIVTRGACSVSADQDVSPAQSALWGLGRVIALELPARWGGLVDLDPAGGEGEIAALVAELLAPDDEDQLAFRAGQRHAARLVSAPPEGLGVVGPLSAQGSYLVTGGLGALGLHVARWLVDKGARHLVLTGRRGLETPGAAGALDALREAGAELTVAAVDVADAAAMGSLLASLKQPLRGVVHAAGLGRLCTLAETDEALLASVLRPKVAGAWVLHCLLEETPLDFFVLFSSGAAVWGGHGQGAYAAGNAFLDGLAQHRRSRGLGATSIAWGVWAEGGMAEDEAQRQLSSIGVLSMPTAPALSAMERVIAAGAAQATVTRMDWGRFAPVYAARGRRKLLSGLAPAAERAASPSSRTWRGQSASQARPALLALVREALAQTLGFGDASSIDPARGFSELGLDSLMAVQLRERLQKALGEPLSSTVAFDHPTVERLVAHLLTEVLKLEDRADVAPSRAASLDEPIAIVGAACRFPGAADGLEAYWQLLSGQGVVTDEVPASRWKVADWYDSNPEAPHRSYVSRGGFVRDIEGFDAAFFRISPREATSLDPQQRLLLEVSWEALENAGQDLSSLQRRPTGVFVGGGPNEYGARMEGHEDEPAALYGGTGNMFSVAAGRLAFFLGLHGPTLAVDTACSSSLVALHLACQSLRSGECEQALVGGVNVLVSPQSFVMLSRMRALAPDGRCKTFSAEADGYGRAEGCGVVVLKRLSDAQRDGDRILAVIRGSAVNHDGASSGLTVPNGPAQQAVIGQALEQAGVAASEVDYVECHGTGTSLGDPIEVQALGAVYGKGRPTERPLVIGTAKANLGHLEPAAGMAGLLKVVLALGHEQLPAQPPFGALNPLLSWETLPVAVAREPWAWARGARPRRAGVSAFGLSGTNAHVIVEEPPANSPVPPAPERAAELLVVSAKSASALSAQAGRLRQHLLDHPELALGDLAFSLATTRGAMEHRLALSVSSREALLTSLAAAASGESPAGVVRGTASAPGKVAFLFTGQGAQEQGMGRALHAQWPAFRQAFDRCVSLFDAELGGSLREVMWAEPGSASEGLLDQTGWTQPALFTLEYALFAQWRAWGVEPSLLAGHSIGELVAACVAGVFSLEDAARLVAARGRLMQALPAGGAMVSIAAPEAEVAAAVAPHQASVSIAAVNGPSQVVVAGEARRVKEIASAFEARGVKTRELRVSHAFHSPLMAPMLEAFEQVARSVRYQAPTVALVSNLSGKLCGEEVAEASYWVRHVREAVRFADGVRALHEAGATTFVELGPKATLLGLVPSCLGEAEARLVATLRAGRGEAASALEALGALWTQGQAVSWPGVFPEGGQRVPLPTYAWRHERFWLDPVVAGQAPLGTSGRWPLGGRAIRTPGTSVHHVLTVGPQHQAFLADHVVFGRVVVPGAFHVAVVLALGNDRWPGRALEVSSVEFLRAIALSEGETVELHALLTPLGSGEGYQFELSTLGGPAGQDWTTHARGEVRPLTAEPGDLPRPEALEPKTTLPVETAAVLGALSSMQIAWGPQWQWLQSGRIGGGAAVAELSPTYEGAHDEAPLHPSLLDNGFAVSLLSEIADVGDGVPRLPFAVERLRWWSAPSGVVRCGAVLRAGGEVADFVLTDATGGVVAEVSGFVSRRAPRELFLPGRNERSTNALFRLEWQPAAADQALPLAVAKTTEAKQATEAEDRPWVLVAAPGSRWAAALATRLDRCVVTEAAGLASALKSAGSVAGVVCLWAEQSDDDVPSAALRLASEGLAVVHALKGHSPVRLWWVTAGAVAALPGEPVAPASSSLWGLGRTVMQEHPELRCTLLDVERSSDPELAAEAVLAALRVADDEPQLALRAGNRLVARLVAARAGEGLAVPDAPSYRLAIGQKGALETLRLVGEERRAPGPGEVEIEVSASGLNFRTVFDSLGLFPGDAGPVGGDCAGVVSAVGPGVHSLSVGDRVITMAPFSRFVTVDARAVVRLDAPLSPAQAATVPAAFLTAWLALFQLAQLRPGERVLIHAAAGGVGMAAVQLARFRGAEVFATAHPSKWPALEALGVPRSHLASSREPGFARVFREIAGARGLDVVLNALAASFVDESLSLLGPGGRFLEMGKVDLRDPAKVAAAHPGVLYRAFDILDLSPDETRAILEQVVAAISAGHLRPLPAQTFPVTEAEAAFRAMAQGKHTGKLVLLPARSPRLSGGTVLVTGGLGALGLHVARQLANEGAGHLVLTGRRGAETPGAAEAVAELEALGAKVTVAAVDVTDRNQVEQLLQGIAADRPLRGVVHAAGVLDDGVLSEQTAERLGRAMAPKVLGAWHLHELTRHTALDFFVLFSSLSGLLGAPGQGNYAAANAFLDALAAERRAEGLAGQSLGWGPWAGGGMASGLSESQRARLAQQGVRTLTPEQGVALFGKALGRPEAHLALVPLDLPSLKRALGAAVPPLWRALVRPEDEHSQGGPRGAWAIHLASLPADRREREVREGVQAEVARVLSLPSASAVPLDRSLQELGLDSLMAVELRNGLGKRVGKTLPATLAFDYPTVGALTRWLLEQVLAVAEPPARKELATTRTSTNEPIAIVGMSCRFPGGVDSPSSFWRMLDQEIDGITEVPRSRWDIDAWYDPDPDAVGKMNTRWGGFLADLESFDPGFFGISSREAASIDPQERLLLEVSWEALENAGQRPERLMGSDTGVYVGICGAEYQMHTMADVQAIDAYSLLGTVHSAVVGRISYFLGLKGPNFPVDTACSSSLVAVHLACQALRNGECSMALAGGVNVVLSPEATVYCSRLKAMSPTGRCHTFSADADGYVRSEGCGVVVLKRLSDAQRDGDRILAVIRGSAVNQDGRSNGLTAPNGPSQEALIRRALAQAGVAASEVDYVECHGTGTPLGDPIEVQALGAVLGEGRSAEQPVLLGSVKTNIGHSEGAAGVAGLIKAVLTLENEKIPKSLHFGKPNPYIPWSELPVKVASESVAWKRGARRRRAGVSSFGISGTNAHLVLEEAPSPAPARTEARAAAADADTALPILLSARTDTALRAQAARLLDHLTAHPDQPVVDVAATLACKRSHLEHRASVVAQGREGLHQALAALAQGQSASSVRTTVVGPAGKLGFLFTGQGSQRPGMGRELSLAFPRFREALEALFAELDPLLPRPLREVMFAEAGTPEAALLDQTGFTQPALFALEVALYRLVESLGVVPDYLLGHSVGELAAAHVAGVLSLRDACRLVVARGQLMQALPPGGAMVAISASAEVLEPLLVGRQSQLGIAAQNGPLHTVISGEETAVLEVARSLEALGRRCTRLTVSHAFHSPRMDAMVAALEEVAAGLTFHPPRIPVISSLTGQEAANGELGHARYWASQARAPVQFLEATRSLEASGVRTFLELGPRGVLCAMAEDCLSEATQPERDLVPVLRGDGREPAALSQALGRLHLRGVAIDFDALFAPLRPRQVELPTYPFERRRHWIETSLRASTGGASPAGSPVDHPLLGAAVPWAERDAFLFVGQLSLRSQPWLGDHRVFSAALLPGTAFVEGALVAAQALGLPAVAELSLASPLPLPESGAVQLQLSVQAPDAQGLRAFSISSQPVGAPLQAPWVPHATGTLRPPSSAPLASLPALSWPPEGARPVDLSGLYEELRARGLDYGPSFQGLRAAWTSDAAVYAQVVLPEAQAAEASRYRVHPALLDAALHALALALPPGAEGTVYLPVAMQGVCIHATSAPELRARLEVHREDGAELVSVSLMAWDSHGQPVLQIERLTLQRVRPEQLRTSRSSQSLFAVQWVPVASPRRQAPTPMGWVLSVAPGAAPRLDWPVIAGQDELTRRLAEAAPACLVIDVTGPAAHEALPAIHERTHQALRVVQACLHDERLASCEVVVLTQGAVSTGPDEGVSEFAQAPLWGLVRSARSEHPERRLRLLDLEASSAAGAIVEALQVEGEPDLALRGGIARAPRVVPAGSDRQSLSLPLTAPSYRLEQPERGQLDALRLVATAEPLRPLLPHEVRVDIRAAGVNFRDVLGALGMYPGDPGPLGLEAAGIVLEAGSEVAHLRPGDRVMGGVPGAMARHGITDGRLLARIPSWLPFTEAATLPITYLTAFYGLFDLGQLGKGSRVLIHAAAGGTGMAAVRLALRAGAEVFATASPSKWNVLRAMGIDDAHLASSRTLDFEQAFLRATHGEGVDVVLNSLAGPFIDASLRLLVRGGRFVEMGKADVREPQAVAVAHPGVSYHSFELMEAGPDRLQAMLQQLVGWVSEGSVQPLPLAAYDLRQAPAAFRFMAQARHTGKLVLTLPRALRTDGTVLVTGGTGELGALVARHLVSAHGVRHLVLLSRQGPDAPGAAALAAQLEALGAHVRVASCDVSNPRELAAILEGIDASVPLRAVLHCSAVLDDGVVSSLTPERIDRVFGPKLDAAFHLHSLTRSLDLDAFVLFSSAAGTLGSPGQGNYAAANAFLDALAAHRRQQGLPGQSLAWGLWQPQGQGLTAKLTGQDLARMERQGVRALTPEEGLELLDAALARPEAMLLPMRFTPALLDHAADALPPLLRSLARVRRPRAASPAGGSGLGARLAALPAEARRGEVLELLRREIAVVLGLADGSVLTPERALNDLGMDSLMAVELRNRVHSLLDVRLDLSAVLRSPSLQGLTDELLRLLSERAPGHQAAPSVSERAEITPSPSLHRPVMAPLSAGQQRLYFLDCALELRHTYHLALAARLAAPLDVSRLRLAVEHMIAGHEQLRTGFVEKDGVPRQRVLPWVEAPVEELTLSLDGASDRDAALRQCIEAEVQKPFDLSRAPLFRVLCVRLGRAESALAILCHHIIADGTSLALLFDGLSRAYLALEQGSEPELAPGPSYLLYADRQQKWLQSAASSAQRALWKAKLEGLPALELPTDRPVPRVRSERGGLVRFAIPAETAADLEALARATGATPFVILTAAWSALLSRYSNQHDFAVGAVVSGRQEASVREAIGFFVNTLPLRCRLEGEPTGLEYIHRLRDEIWSILDQQDLPLDEIVRAVAPDRQAGFIGSPLFRTCFVYEEAHWAPDSFAGLGAFPVVSSVVDREGGTSKFDLQLTIARRKQAFVASLEFSADIFDRATIERCAGHFTTLLTHLAAAPERPLHQLPLLTEAERHRALVTWNDTAACYPRERRLHEGFEEQVERAPDATAVVFDDESLTYRSLNAKANQLARRLRALGAGPDVFVAICVERSLDMVVGILGTLKSGSAYVPIDPDYPRDRIAYMLDDTRPVVLLTQRSFLDRLPELPAGVTLCLDEPSLFDGEPSGNLEHVGTSSHLAYVIYTSGSTGRPKGVAMEHHSVINLLGALDARGWSRAPQRAALQAPVVFDMSIKMLFGSLLYGHTLFVVDKETRRDGGALLAFFRRHAITIADCTPSLLAMLVDAGLPTYGGLALQMLLCGGEPLPTATLASVFSTGQHPALRVINGYGPTETCVNVNANLVTAGTLDTSRATVPLGLPFENTQIYVLDAHLEPVPVGVAGELHIGGVGLARGYLNQPEQTAQKFIPDPFGQAPGGRLYKTGDLVRHLPDGKIEFLSRIDHQVKIRGYRIELGEIESVLSAHPDVASCVVMARDDLPGGRRLVAYAVPQPGCTLDAEALRSHMARLLPDYMLPWAIVPLSALPLTSNGKVDRKALPAPSTEPVSDAFVPPATPLESALASIFSSVLKVKAVGRHDDFFALGGDSLLAVKAVTRAQQAGLSLTVRQLFATPTVAKLVESTSADEPSCLVPLRQGSARGAVVLVPPAGGVFYRPHDIARALEVPMPVFGLISPAIVGAREQPDSVEALASVYARAIAEKVPDGPITLVGYSFGGSVSIELTGALLAMNRVVEQVILLDTRARSEEAPAELDPLTALGALLDTMGIAHSPTQGLSFEQSLAEVVSILAPDLDDPAGLQAYLGSLLEGVRASTRMLAAWRPRLPEVPTHLLRAEGDDGCGPDGGWGRYGTLASVRAVPGGHFAILRAPYLEGTMKAVRSLIDRRSS